MSQDRRERYRLVGAGAGLVRVEVLVPPVGREAILREAARLREEHRGSLTPSMGMLYDEAVTRFGARCLWNVSPSRSVEGLRVVADRLRRYGGMDAWKLSSRIKEELKLAAR